MRKPSPRRTSPVGASTLRLLRARRMNAPIRATHRRHEPSPLARPIPAPRPPSTAFRTQPDRPGPGVHSRGLPWYDGGDAWLFHEAVRSRMACVRYGLQTQYATTATASESGVRRRRVRQTPTRTAWPPTHALSVSRPWTARPHAAKTPLPPAVPGAPGRASPMLVLRRAKHEPLHRAARSDE